MSLIYILSQNRCGSKSPPHLHHGIVSLPPLQRVAVCSLQQIISFLDTEWDVTCKYDHKNLKLKSQLQALF